MISLSHDLTSNDIHRSELVSGARCLWTTYANIPPLYRPSVARCRRKSGNGTYSPGRIAGNQKWRCGADPRVDDNRGRTHRSQGISRLSCCHEYPHSSQLDLRNLLNMLEVISAFHEHTIMAYHSRCDRDPIGLTPKPGVTRQAQLA